MIDNPRLQQIHKEYFSKHSEEEFITHITSNGVYSEDEIINNLPKQNTWRENERQNNVPGRR